MGGRRLEISRYLHLNPVRVQALGLGKAERAGLGQSEMGQLVGGISHAAVSQSVGAIEAQTKLAEGGAADQPAPTALWRTSAIGRK